MPATSTTAGQPENEPTHVIRTRVQKWRFKCTHPDHHDDWRLWNGVFYCRTCQALRDAGELDVEPVMDQLWDAKEDRLVSRDRIRIER